MLNVLDIVPTKSLGYALVALIPAYLAFTSTMKFLGFKGLTTRQRTIPPKDERVIIFGASSGIGRSLALEYARRGARVCVVARRQRELEILKEEMMNISASELGIKGPTEDNPLIVIADATKAEDVLQVRDEVNTRWKGLDTLIVTAGVSALRPLLDIAGCERENGKLSSGPTLEGVQRTVNAATAAIQGNYTGPMIATVTFIPLLTSSSDSPSILLLSSVAAVIPAPTRSLYASTKGASLLLYQSLAIEHPEIHFTFILPGTVEGSFRASAVDGGLPREADPQTTGLKLVDVAQRCVRAIDHQEKTVFMTEIYRFGHLMYWLWPSFVEGKARKKYQFST